MTNALAEYVTAVQDPSALEARIAFCRRVSKCLRSTGNVLWAYGLSDSPSRRSLAVVLQMAGSLTEGTCALLDLDNWYGSAALLRQIVEVEYLLWLFSVEPVQAEKWLSASQADLRRMYAPAAMRKKSAGRFRDTEYWSHCEMGGHPNPKAAALLDEHSLPGDRSPLGSPRWLWVDLSQHLERLWSFAALAVNAHGLAHVGIAADCLAKVPTYIAEWHAADHCAALIPETTEWRAY